MAKIFLSVPILGRPELKMIYSMYQAILTCREHQVRIYFSENDSLISRVRNCHISAFLNDFPDMDYFMSVDSDLEIVNCYPNNNIFNKLISHNLDFVGGLYALKKQGARRCSSITIDGSYPQFDSGLTEMKWLSSGCFCIKRSAVEKLANAYSDRWYDGDDNFSGKKVIDLYSCMLYDLKEGDFPNVQLPFKKKLSEDWSLCQRWKEIGGKIFADTSVVLNHIGSYSFSLWNLEVVKSDKPLPPQPGFDLEREKEN